MNITIQIPFLSWTGKPSLSIEIDASIEARFRMRAAVLKAVAQRANLGGANLRSANLRSANLRSANLGGANLGGANLGGANLGGANLGGANLGGADLGGADLGGANLRSANLRSANLGGANLGGANLGGADLGGADLGGANLRGANLRSANLGGAHGLDEAKNAELAAAMTSITPEGALVGWKKCNGGVIVGLLIPVAAKRSNATGRKCRAEYAEVLEVIGADMGVSNYDGTTKYRVGETVRCANWEPNRFRECAGGIHFFLTRAEAEAYVF